MKKQPRVFSLLAGMFVLAVNGGSANAAPCEKFIIADANRPLSVLQTGVHDVLHARNFIELDALAADYSKVGATTTDGQEKVLGLFGGFVVIGPCQNYSKQELTAHLDLLGQWKSHTRFPHLAELALVEMEIAAGWIARRDDDDNGYRSHMRTAALKLDAMGSRGRRYPTWYRNRLIVANGMDIDAAAYNALFDEAITAFPASTELYFEKSHYLDQRSDGSRKEVNDYIAAVDASHSAIFGPHVLYTHLHANARHEKMFEEDVDWNLFSEGFKNLITRYPDVYNRNRYALFACEHNAPYVFREQMALIGERISTNVFRNPGYVTYCREQTDAAIRSWEAQEAQRQAAKAAEIRSQAPPAPK